jgi:hypothetical protein
MASTVELLSKHRAAFGVAAVASTAFALFGYDTTIAGGVIALKRYILSCLQFILTNRFQFPGRVQAVNECRQIR